MSMKTKKIIFCTMLVMIFISLMSMAVFAQDGYDKKSEAAAKADINKIAGIIAGVFRSIGIFVVFIGGIQVAWAMSSDNPEMKGQAIKLIAAGILVIVMSTSYNLIAGN